ncbi:caspase family protein [Thioclava sp. FR2]|uniref:caspase family protein n=1 Tax=Thioclava sp. FR2 TaxID=3445780 RepID=UPI003EBAA41D
MATAGATEGVEDEEHAFVHQLTEDAIGMDVRLALSPSTEPSLCGQSEPQTRALLTGANAWSGEESYDLLGTENDTDLLAQALIARGAKAENIVRLKGLDATHVGFTKAAQEGLDATQCGDSVILHFSGWVMDPSFFAPAQLDFGPFVMSYGDIATLQDWTTMALGRRPANALVEKGPWFILNQSAYGKADVLSADALSGLITLLRNRGADVSVFLDTSIAEAMRLEDRQVRVDPDGLWRTRLDPDGVSPTQEQLLNSGAGAFSVFYGTAAGEITLELSLPANAPNSQRYGAFSFALAQAILSQERSTPSALGRELTNVDFGEEQRGWTYLVSTTDPDRDIIVERRRPETPEDRTIKILSPEETRAASPLDQADILLRGQVLAPSETIIVIIEGKLVP